MLITVGHIEHIAIVNIAAGSGFWNSTKPERQPRQRRNRPQDLDDRIEARVELPRHAEEEAERRADQQRERVALRHADQRVPGEPQDALIQLAAFRRTAPRCTSFAPSQVRAGDGRSVSRTALTSAHKPIKHGDAGERQHVVARIAASTSGTSSAFQVVDGERLRVLLRLRRVERHAVEERLGLLSIHRRASTPSSFIASS